MDKCEGCWWYPDECSGSRLRHRSCVRWSPDGFAEDEPSEGEESEYDEPAGYVRYPALTESKKPRMQSEAPAPGGEPGVGAAGK